MPVHNSIQILWMPLLKRSMLNLNKYIYTKVYEEIDKVLSSGNYALLIFAALIRGHNKSINEQKR